MEIVLIVVGVLVAVAILAASPLSKRSGEAADAEARAIARGADVEHQFKRPPSEGGLL